MKKHSMVYWQQFYHLQTLIWFWLQIPHQVYGIISLRSLTTLKSIRDD